MKLKLFALSLLVCLCAFAQTLPTLPSSNTLTSAGITCTFNVIDNQMSVSSQCVDASGTILHQGSAAPHVKGTLLGTGPILCLHWTDGAPTPTVRLQCSSDDDTGPGPKMVLDGKLAPVNKKRVWWLFWK